MARMLWACWRLLLCWSVKSHPAEIAPSDMDHLAPHVHVIVAERGRIKSVCELVLCRRHLFAVDIRLGYCRMVFLSSDFWRLVQTRLFGDLVPF